MSRAVMQQALEALEQFRDISDFTPASAVHAITALRQALAEPEPEPEQEPVAWWNGRETVWFEHELMGTNPPIENPIPLYTTPTPRTRHRRAA